MSSTKGEFALTLKGAVYKFKMGTTALIELQEMLSTPTNVLRIEDILHQVQMGRVKFVRAFLWAGLQKYHDGMTLEDVSDLLDESSEPEVAKLLMDLGMTTVPAPADARELAGGKRPQKARRRNRGNGAISVSPHVSPGSAEPTLGT